MDRWNALELLIIGVVLFAYFVPVFGIPPPSNCVFCPAEPQYGSLTYVLLGHGGQYVGFPMSGYYSIRW
jgi:hypothetical protein